MGGIAAIPMAVKNRELTPKPQDYYARLRECITSASNQLKPE
jgi:hypothetical protein